MAYQPLGTRAGADGRKALHNSALRPVEVAGEHFQFLRVQCNWFFLPKVEQTRTGSDLFGTDPRKRLPRCIDHRFSRDAELVQIGAIKRASSLPGYLSRPLKRATDWARIGQKIIRTLRVGHA